MSPIILSKRKNIPFFDNEYELFCNDCKWLQGEKRVNMESTEPIISDFKLLTAYQTKRRKSPPLHEFLDYCLGFSTFPYVFQLMRELLNNCVHFSIVVFAIFVHRKDFSRQWYVNLDYCMHLSTHVCISPYTFVQFGLPYQTFVEMQRVSNAFINDKHH